MKSSPFRAWLQNLYMANSDEHDEFHEPKLALEEYFRRYKWWLKREYKFQQRLSK